MDFEDKVTEHLRARAFRIEDTPSAGLDSIHVESVEYRGPWLAIGAAAAVLVVIGGIGIVAQSSSTARDEVGGDLSPSPIAATTSTTGTGDVDANDRDVSGVWFARGSLSIDPLEFTVVDGGPGVDFVQVVAQRDRVTYALGFVTGDARHPPSSSLWSTSDGIAWTEISTFPGDASMFLGALLVDEDGFAAIGSRVEGEPCAGSAFGYPHEAAASVWTSGDGVAWTVVGLESNLDTPLPTTMFGIGIARDGDRIVATGMEQPNIEALIIDRLPRDVRDLLDAYDLPGIGWGGTPFEFSISGPGGLVIYSGGADDLGLSEEEEAAVNELFSGHTTENTQMWVSDDGTDWVAVASPPLGYIHSLARAPDGGFIALVSGPQESGFWSSPDGVDWRLVSRIPQTVDKMIVEGGRVFGTRYVNESESIVEWNAHSFVQISPTDAFSGPGSWHFRSLTASGRGIVAVATGYPDEAFTEEVVPSVVSIEASNGFTIEIDGRSGLLSVRGSQVLLRVDPWQEKSDQVELDLERGTITFLDPISGDVLTEISIDELVGAQQALRQSHFIEESRSVVLHTADGVNWSITDLGDVGGSGFSAEQVVLIGDTVVVLGRDMASYEFSSDDPLPPYQILVATP